MGRLPSKSMPCSTDRIPDLEGEQPGEEEVLERARMADGRGEDISRVAERCTHAFASSRVSSKEGLKNWS